MEKKNIYWIYSCLFEKVKKNVCLVIICWFQSVWTTFHCKQYKNFLSNKILFIQFKCVKMDVVECELSISRENAIYGTRTCLKWKMKVNLHLKIINVIINLLQRWKYAEPLYIFIVQNKFFLKNKTIIYTLFKTHSVEHKVDL